MAATPVPRQVTVRLVDDADIELPESFVVTLSQTSGGAVLGTIRDAEVQILDDDGGARNMVIEGYMACNNTNRAPDTMMALLFGLLTIRPGRRRCN